jgi:hypothetical protein
VGYNGRCFFPLWDITEEFFSTVGYNGEGFPPFWDTTEEDIFRCGIQQENLRMANNFFFSIVSHNTGHFSSVVSYTTTESYAVYCIPGKSSALYPTTPQVFFRCIPQWKIFSSIVGYNGRGFFVVGYNGRGFFPLWDTTEEVFFLFGIERKRFFPVVGYSGKKLYNAELYF